MGDGQAPGVGHVRDVGRREPAELRQRDGIEPGQEFEVERLGADEYRLLRVTPAPNEGLVDWLLACPQKGYFVAIDSESTDTL